MIRPARPEDAAAIQSLVRELAAHHGHPDEVDASDADLRRALFADGATTHALVADVDGAVVGVAIWFVSYSTWTGTNNLYLEDLVVTADARGAGVGGDLMSELRRIARQRGYRRIDWQVLDGNDGAMRFYRSLGAEPVPEQRPWRLTP